MALKLILAFALSLAATLLLYPILIPYLHKIKFGQSIREDGPQSHKKKAGTPTMGGTLFIVVPLVVNLLVQPNAYGKGEFLLCVLAFVGYGVIGFIDDYLIVVKKNNDGLKPSYKFAMQSVLAVVFYLVYRSHSDSGIIIPLFDVNLDLGLFYAVIVFFMFTGTSNAVNLSDGLDGLCAGLSILALIPFGYFCYRSNQQEILILIGSLIGALLGYLKYNHHPAQIFMGDTGSLAIGGLLAAVAMITKEEIALILVGGVFIVEVLSVCLQVASFKLTGKRIFKMSPIHHHFELSGWSETKIVLVFWGCGLILSILGVLIAVL